MRTFSHLRLDVSYMLRGYAQAESSKVPGRYFFFLVLLKFVQFHLANFISAP